MKANREQLDIRDFLEKFKKTRMLLRVVPGLHVTVGKKQREELYSKEFKVSVIQDSRYYGFVLFEAVEGTVYGEL